MIDVAGGAAFNALLEALQPGGRLATAGAIAGPLVETDLHTVYLKDLTIFGCTYQPEAVFAELVDLIRRGSKDWKVMPEPQKLALESGKRKDVVSSSSRSLRSLHVTVTERYAHLAPEHVRVAVLAVDRYRAQSGHVKSIPFCFSREKVHEHPSNQ